ncbi:SAM-dependent methyltransferase [Nonomuraea recticatena]
MSVLLQLAWKDNFAADREAAEKIVSLGAHMDYDIGALVRANRAFLGRALRELADTGVRQFLDLGTGLPARENVH